MNKQSTIAFKIWTYVSLILLGMIIGASLYAFIVRPAQSFRSIDSTIILDRIKSVSKLVTTEGYYSNVYHMENYRWVNLYPFKKQVTFKVKLKALVGVDLTKMVVTPDEQNKVIYIENVPEVEPIAIDPIIEFFDMSNGMFNDFDKEDLNEINSIVRNMSIMAIKNENKESKNQVEDIRSLINSEQD
jgi:hypothetical protein